MTLKPIRWFEMTEGIPGAFYNRNPKTCTVCLNYKDYNNRPGGLKPWFLTSEIVIPPLINEWGSAGHWDPIKQGAQQMVTYAASNDAIGFQDGDFYGIFWVFQRVLRSPEVHIGLVYVSVDTQLDPIQGVVERSYPFDESHHWVTPSFAIPLQFEVQLDGHSKGVHRVSRYNRTPVI